MTERVYLDWNASAPLRPEARDAMLAAMATTGNPSSVHAEGRAARAMIERAREQVAALATCDREQVIFTSGATEAAALALHGVESVWGLSVEHDAVQGWATHSVGVDHEGRPVLSDLEGAPDGATLCWQDANGETGVIQTVWPTHDGWRLMRDVSQSAGKIPVVADGATLILSAHKFGGPRGVGVVIAPDPDALEALLRGGGQEKRKRSGTENVAAIAGMGAAAETAKRDVGSGLWDGVEERRDLMEAQLLAISEGDIHIVAEDAARLPNTSLILTPGWKGETQVMQLDLAGFGVSAGSACASGKVAGSRVLKAMGYDDSSAASAIRISIGPTTTETDIARFTDAWTTLYRRHKARAA